MGVCKPCIEKLYLWAIILEENAQPVSYTHLRAHET